MKRVAACLLLSGCSSFTIHDTQRITLQDEMVGTVQALNATGAEARKPGNHPWGFYPCTLIATFTLSSTGIVDNKVSVGGSLPVGKGIAITSNAGGETSESSSRAGTVTLQLVSPLCVQQVTQKNESDKDKIGALPAPPAVFPAIEPLMFPHKEP